MKMSIKYLYKAGVCLALASCVTLGFTSCGDSTKKQNEAISSPGQTEEKAESVIIENAQWSPDMKLDSKQISLDYADSTRIVFHEKTGLFVYDLQDGALTATVDLNSLGMNKTSGREYYEVTVSEDGNQIWLHEMADENMYCYDIAKGKMKKTVYDSSEIKKTRAKQEVIDVREALTNFSDKKDEPSAVSNAIRLSAEEEEAVYCWMTCEDGTFGGVNLVIKNQQQETLYPLFGKEPV